MPFYAMWLWLSNWYSWFSTQPISKYGAIAKNAIIYTYHSPTHKKTPYFLQQGVIFAYMC